MIEFFKKLLRYFKRSKDSPATRRENYLGLTEIEEDRLYKFIDSHKHCKCTSTIGGKFTYTIIPTGLGNITHVRCNVCNEETDITDIDSW